MREDTSGRRQRAVMATDAEWERIGRAAAAVDNTVSRYVRELALADDPDRPHPHAHSCRQQT